MYLWRLLTKALFFKPKRTENGWEHKSGFYVSLKDANAAFSIIERARNERKGSLNKRKTKNHYLDVKRDRLRAMADDLLYEIQSSSNNYIETICAFGGLFLLGYLINLIIVIWSYPTIETVRSFLISSAIFGFLIFSYFKKQSLDKSKAEMFLDIEDALFQLEYSESQYKN